MPTPYRDAVAYRSAFPYQGQTAVPVYGGAQLQGDGILQETPLLRLGSGAITLQSDGVLQETSLLLASGGAMQLIGDGQLSAKGAALLSGVAFLVGDGVLSRIASVDGAATLQGDGVLTSKGAALRFSELLQLIGEGELVIEARIGARSATLPLSEAIIR